MPLFQFRCYKEGTLFYYFHGFSCIPSHIVSFCPVCGSTRVGTTGKTFEFEEV